MLFKEAPPRTRIARMLRGTWVVEVSDKTIGDRRDWVRKAREHDFAWLARREARKWLKSRKPLPPQKYELVGLPGEPTCICVGPKLRPSEIITAAAVAGYCQICGGKT